MGDDWNASNLSWADTWGGYSISTDTVKMNPNKNMRKKMKKKYDEARIDAMLVISKALREANDIKVIYDDDTEEIIGYSDDGSDGGLVAFKVKVSVGAAVEADAAEMVEQIKDERERREAVFGSDE